MCCAAPAPAALRGGHHAHPRPQDHGAHLRVRQDGACPPRLCSPGPVLGLRSQSLRHRCAAARSAAGAASPAAHVACVRAARCALALTTPRAAGGDWRENGGDGEACSTEVRPHHPEAAVPGAVQGARRDGLAAAVCRGALTSRPRPQQDFTIQNIVASCDVRFPIRLEGLSYAHPQFSNVRRGGASSPRARRLPRLTLGAHCSTSRSCFRG